MINCGIYPTSLDRGFNQYYPTSLDRGFNQYSVNSRIKTAPTDSDDNNGSLVELAVLTDNIVKASDQCVQNLIDLTNVNSSDLDKVTKNLTIQEASAAEQQQQLSSLLLQVLTPEQVTTNNSTVEDLKTRMDVAIQHGSDEFEQSIISVKTQLAAGSPGVSMTSLGNESHQISVTADNTSFFALMITVMLFCYNSSSDYGKVMLLKQKDAQAAASSTTDWQKFFLELKDLVNNDKLSDKDMYSLFKDGFGPSPNPAVKNVLGKYLDMFDMSGMKWDGSSTDKTQFNNMLNASIDKMNKDLINNGVSKESTLNPFDSTDYSTAANKSKLLSFCDSQGKICESSSSQLTTINQNLQASVNQVTETIKSIIEWLKTSIQGYGTAINPRG